MTDELKFLTCESFSVKIYMAGDVFEAERLLQKASQDGGLCVNVYGTNYVYRYGRECGYVVEIINYPRFPEKLEDCKSKAVELAKLLLHETYQGSCTVVTPWESIFLTRRGSD